MKQAEYERRRIDLEAEMEAALDLVRSAYRTQFRALDLVWMNSPENRGGVAVVYDPPQLPRPIALFPAPAAPEPPPPAPKRRSMGELYYQLLDLLPSLPEVFDRTHILAVLQPAPNRSSLYKMLEELRMNEEIERVQAGSGSFPSTYRRKAVPVAESASGC
jgi:hypothetical protein